MIGGAPLVFFAIRTRFATCKSERDRKELWGGITRKHTAHKAFLLLQCLGLLPPCLPEEDECVTGFGDNALFLFLVIIIRSVVAVFHFVCLPPFVWSLNLMAY